MPTLGFFDITHGMSKDKEREFIRIARRIETCAPALQAVAAVCLLYGPAQG